MSGEQTKTYGLETRFKPGNKTSFKPGHKPWNAGLKGWDSGGMSVEVRNDAADFDDAEVVDTTFYIKKSGREVVVFIDV